MEGAVSSAAGSNAGFSPYKADHSPLRYGLGPALLPGTDEAVLSIANQQLAIGNQQSRYVGQTKTNRHQVWNWDPHQGVLNELEYGSISPVDR
jgi:hypothetical protein